MQISRNICCTQDDNLTVKEKKQVCDDIGCIYEKCGWQKDGYDDDAWEDDGYNDDKTSWKRDGYNDDNPKPAWEDDGYNDDKSSWKKDGYDDDDSKPSWNDDGYDQKNKYNKKGNKESWYDFKNSYMDDECSAEDREKCCTANSANQRDVCDRVGCNIKKVRLFITNTSSSIISAS